MIRICMRITTSPQEMETEEFKTQERNPNLVIKQEYNQSKN